MTISKNKLKVEKSTLDKIEQLYGSANKEYTIYSGTLAINKRTNYWEIIWSPRIWNGYYIKINFNGFIEEAKGEEKENQYTKTYTETQENNVVERVLATLDAVAKQNLNREATQENVHKIKEAIKEQEKIINKLEGELSAARKAKLVLSKDLQEACPHINVEWQPSYCHDERSYYICKDCYKIDP